MAAGFDIAPSALATASGEVDRVHGELAAALGDVRAEVTSLVGDGWRGAAATAFGAGYDEWQRGATQVLAALLDTGSALSVSRAAYVGADDASSDTFARLAARLGGAA